MGRRPVAAERILKALLAARNDDIYGLELIEATGLGSGSVYPALMLLEDRAWVVSRWEEADPELEGRPRRRLYRLTPNGCDAAASLPDVETQWFVSKVPTPGELLG